MRGVAVSPKCSGLKYSRTKVYNEFLEARISWKKPVLTHYIPLYYLRGFVEQGEREIIYVFDKATESSFATTPKNVAAEHDYYPEEVEQFLANLVEDPCNRMLHQIREDLLFSVEDKNEFSRYILAMIRRVPRHRERLYQEVLPDALEDTVSNWRSTIQSLMDDDRLDSATYSRRMAEIDRIEREWKQDLPKGLKPENQLPQISPEVVDFLASMHWTFVIAEGSSMFLTSDNPVFYTEGIGMGKPESELMFPLSTRVALWVKRLPISEDCAFRRARQFLVRETNKRTIHNATRFVMYHEDSEWVRKLTKKRNLKFQQLSPKDHGLYRS